MRRLIAPALATLMAGCAVGPNFHRPAAMPVASYRAGGDNSRAGQAYDPQAAIAFDWWRAYQCPALDALIARAIANSPQVDAAQARLRAAQAQLRAGYGAFFPAVGASFDATREKYSPSRLGSGGAGSVFSLFTPSIAISYALDLFGGNRRAAESLRASAEQQQQTLRATYLTLAGNVASAAISRAQFHEQVEAWAAIVTAQTEQVEAAHARVVGGVATTASALALEQQLDTSRAALAAVQAKAAQADDLLAILIGDPPAAAHLPDIQLADLHLSAALPLRLPSALVRLRPDILAAEAAAHAASADVGVATAAMLPDVTLSAGMGSSANTLERLFSAGTGVWSYGAGVSAPLFEGGALLNRRAAAKAQYQAAMANYRQSVLQAFGQVADTLSAIDADTTAEQAQDRSQVAARTTYQLAVADHKAGLLSDADLQTSLITWQQARVTLLSVHAQHLQDGVALPVALGGGWWDQPEQQTK